MRYTIRPGVVLASVCGEAILVATRPARGKCPYVNRLNATGAYFWSLLEQGMELDQIVEDAARHYDIGRERLRSDLRRFMESLRAQGYLLAEDEA